MKNTIAINGTEVLFTTESKALPNQLAISTKKIARAFGKNHKIVLRDFREAIAKMEEIGGYKIGPTSPAPIYGEATYTDNQGKKRPMLAIGEKLFYQVALAYNGDLAFKIRRDFIDAFYEVKRLLVEAMEIYQKRSSGQRNRRRRELKDIIAKKNIQIEGQKKLIADCLAFLQEK